MGRRVQRLSRAGDGYAYDQGDRRITRYLVKNRTATIEFFDGPERPNAVPAVELV
ncbi:MAG: hypothetical protein ACOYN0_17570 [Phycisphaerales bacterium]